MTEASESGAALAWRLLATLEGGTFILTTTAILVHTIRNKLVKYNTERHRNRVVTKKIVKNVIVSDTNSSLSGDIKTALASRGCHVTSGNQSGAISDKYQAIVVIGAETTGNRLEDLTNVVSQDIHRNLKVLESLCLRLQPGGYIVWVATSESRSRAFSGAYTGAGKAFDNVLKSHLNVLAKSYFLSKISSYIYRRWLKLLN